MKERIIQFLKENNLSSTKFADIIGVQRSSISHILSGRNKPSFDFIEKMLLAYPDINAQWLLIGKGNMFIKQLSLFDNNKEEVFIKNLSSQESNITNSNRHSPAIANSEDEIVYKKKTTLLNDENKEKIERIVIFYSNGVFKEYKPA